MKRHLNTSYRLVWNHITGTLVVASELARSRGKRTGVAVALSLAAVTSVPALAADTVVQAGETVNGGTLTNHDNQIVLGTAFAPSHLRTIGTSIDINGRFFMTEIRATQGFSLFFAQPKSTYINLLMWIQLQLRLYPDSIMFVPTQNP